MLDGPAEFFASTVDVDAEEAWSAIGAGVLVLVDHRPDDLAVGVGDGELELATDWGAEPLVGCFDPMEEQDASILVAEIAQTGKLVRQRAVRRVLGHSGQDIGGITHELR